MSGAHIIPLRNEKPSDKAQSKAGGTANRPTHAQLVYLKRGLTQPGHKLPLFDDFGQKVSERTVRACIEHGWAEPWFQNPLKPDWLVCRLTPEGRVVAQQN